MNETSFRSDEQAQSQDRERLQEDIQEAWDHLMLDLMESDMTKTIHRVKPYTVSSDIKLLKWALGVK
jgi:hypothetical protein